MNEDFDITNYLPYLLNRAGTRIANAFTEEIRAQGITLPIWRVLAALHHLDGQRIGALAEATSIDVSTLSRLIGAMEKKGLAVRRRPGLDGGQGDARIVTAHLTPAGKAVTEKFIPLAERYERTALAGFSREEEAALKGMLRRLYANMASLETAEETEAAA